MKHCPFCPWPAAKTCLTILLASVLFGCGGSGNNNPLTQQTPPAPGFLYATSQDGITAFPFNSSTGALGTGSQATSVFAASDPLANMVTDPAGKFLFACSLYGSSSEAFSISSDTDQRFYISYSRIWRLHSID